MNGEIFWSVGHLQKLKEMTNQEDVFGLEDFDGGISQLSMKVEIIKSYFTELTEYEALKITTDVCKNELLQNIIDEMKRA